MPQQKKTETTEAFKALSSEEQEWCVLVSMGENNTDAYRKVYPDRAESWTDGALRVAAHRLSKKANVLLILDSMAEEQQERANVTLESHVSELGRLAKRAELAGNYGAAVNAEVNRGKAAGLYVERTADVTPTDPITLLTQLAETCPEAAQALARKYGYELEMLDTEGETIQ